MRTEFLLPITIFLFAIIFSGCLVDPVCFEDSDCSDEMQCTDGSCQYECTLASDCQDGYICEEHQCIPDYTIPITCPQGMINIGNRFCMDQYEASRMDATSLLYGSDESSCQSKEGVLPWMTNNPEDAQSACESAGKRLCTPDEWEYSCGSGENLVYAYGNTYDTEICNGIDAFGRDYFHLEATGSFSDCINSFGVYDLNGNVWEYTSDATTTTVRGGAYNCSNSEKLHKCSYIPGYWSPSALGFRCCANGTPQDQTDE